MGFPHRSPQSFERRIPVRRILIVDSDKDSRALIARYARLEGYEATEASDPETGVSLCRQNPFDLMVLEVSSQIGRAHV